MTASVLTPQDGSAGVVGLVSTVHTPAMVQTLRVGALAAPPGLDEAPPAGMSGHCIVLYGTLFHILDTSKQGGRRPRQPPHPLQTGSHLAVLSS